MPTSPDAPETTWPAGADMANRIRRFDWAGTPLGPQEVWPQSLRTAVDILLGSGHAMQLAWGPARTVIYNDAYVPMLGGHHPRALGIPFPEAWPEIWDEIAPLVDRVFAGETVRFEDMPLTLTRHGYPEETWWNFSYSPVRDESGAVAGLLNVTVDATPKVRAAAAERALRTSEQRLRGVLDGMGEAFGLMDRDVRIITQNQAALRLDGRPLEEIRGRTHWEVYPGSEDTELGRLYKQALREGVPVSLEHRYEWPGGGASWLEMRAYPVPEGLAVFWRDISERKAAEVALRESEERQAYLLRLSDSLRPLGAPQEIRRVATEMLGGALGADRAYYVDYDAEAGFGIVGDDYRLPGLPSLAGRYPFQAFQTTYERVQHGGPWLVSDVASAEGIADGERAHYARQGVIAWANVPLLKQGRLHAVLCVVQGRPRRWTPAEVSLIEETSERTWAAIERARAEAALRESERTLRIALEAGRMGTYRFDVKTGIEQWSDSEYDMLGIARTGGAPTRDLFLSVVHPDDRHRVEFGEDDQRPEGTPLDSEFRIIRPDTGEVRWITAHALALFGPDGKPSELIGVNLDITDQRTLEAAMHTSEERLREFSEASSDILWTRRADDLQWDYLSPAFHKVYGLSRQDAMRGDNLQTWAELILPEDREHALASIEQVRQGRRAAYEYRIRRPEDGQIRWLRNTDFPIRDETGRVVRIGGIGHDLTELKLAEEHQKLLLSELQHRVRNTLAVIRSIVRRTAATASALEDYTMHLEGRIDAFARVQSEVTRDPGKGVDLGYLIAEELRLVGAQEGRGCTIGGPSLALAPKSAETLGLAIHELATNAVKYGALAAQDGRLEVLWSLRDNGTMLVLSWREWQLDTPLTPPTRYGFGMEILEKTLAYELKAKTRSAFLPEGFRCSIEMPLAKLVASAANR